MNVNTLYGNLYNEIWELDLFTSSFWNQNHDLPLKELGILKIRCLYAHTLVI